jgi:hypothetical protein
MTSSDEYFLSHPSRRHDDVTIAMPRPDSLPVAVFNGFSHLTSL